MELSVVIPAYQSASHIKLTVEKVYFLLKDSFKNNFEIIVVEDGSNDDTLLILNSLDIDCLRIIKNYKNLGQAVSTTIGIKESHGDIIITYDDDMKYPTEGITKLFFTYKEVFIGQRLIIYGFIKSPLLSNIFRKITDWLAGKPFATSLRCFSKSLVEGMPHEQLEVYLFNNFPELEIRYMEFMHEFHLASRTGIIKRLMFILFMFPKFKRSKLNYLLKNWFFITSAILLLGLLLLKQQLILICLLILIVYLFLFIIKYAGIKTDPFKTEVL